MISRLWYMNADFEAELAAPAGSYRPLPSFDALNRRLVGLVSPARSEARSALLFTPWGWTPSAVAAGERAGAVVAQAIPLSTVARVNSKLWSHALEAELGIAQPGAA